jgi:hypothetical protein
MSRTTLDIDDPVLQAVKRLQEAEGGSLGRVVSRLLSEALDGHQRAPRSEALEWIAKPMRARLDLEDKEALHAVLDQPMPR